MKIVRILLSLVWFVPLVAESKDPGSFSSMILMRRYPPPPAGPPGPEGPPGPMGAPGGGPPGDQGAPGVKGPQGDKGPKGPIGDAGPAGPAGEEGPSGIKGATGKEGPEGPQGFDGAPGESGPIGPQGREGPVGEKGPQGEKGERGGKAVSALSVSHTFSKSMPLLSPTEFNGTVVSTGNAIAFEKSHFLLKEEGSYFIQVTLQTAASSPLGSFAVALNGTPLLFTSSLRTAGKSLSLQGILYSSGESILTVVPVGEIEAAAGETLHITLLKLGEP